MLVKSIPFAMLWNTKESWFTSSRASDAMIIFSTLPRGRQVLAPPGSAQTTRLFVGLIIPVLVSECTKAGPACSPAWAAAFRMVGASGAGRYLRRVPMSPCPQAPVPSAPGRRRHPRSCLPATGTQADGGILAPEIMAGTPGGGTARGGNGCGGHLPPSLPLPPPSSLPPLLPPLLPPSPLPQGGGPLHVLMERVPPSPTRRRKGRICWSHRATDFFSLNVSQSY